MFPPKKKTGATSAPSFGKKPVGAAATDDLESPDPVEGKPAEDPAEESAEPPAEESTEDADYGAKLMADITAAGEAMGMDAAASRKAAGAFFKAAADCLGGGGEGEDSGLDMGAPDMNESDTEIYPA